MGSGSNSLREIGGALIENCIFLSAAHNISVQARVGRLKIQQDKGLIFIVNVSSPHTYATTYFVINFGGFAAHIKVRRVHFWDRLPGATARVVKAPND